MRKFNAWLLARGEALPIIEKERLWRVGMLAKSLAARGHNVTWWTSTFIHHEKRYFCNEHKEFQVNPNLKLVLLHSRIHYRYNTSPARIIYNQLLANEFLKHSQDYPKPDIIYCSWPTPQFSRAAVTYGTKHNVPVVLDIRDLWPDIYDRALPGILRPLGRLAIHFMRRAAGHTLAKASGIIGVTPSAVQWGCERAGRSVGENDRVIFIGNETSDMSDSERQDNLSWWQAHGVTPETWNMCYFGNLNKGMVDIETVIASVKRLLDGHKDIRLVIGGSKEDSLERTIAGCEAVIFPGWLNQKQMNTLMSISKCGMYCFKDLTNLSYMFGNKVIQYLSGGLPVINSLSGFAKTFLEEHHCGLTYKEGDIDDCTAKILALHDNEELRLTMSHNALEIFKTTFDSDIINQQFEDYFIKIIDTFRKRTH